MTTKEGLYYVLDMTVIAVFDFPGNATEDETKEYFESAGTSRMFDFARTAAESMTAYGVFGPIGIPMSYPEFAHN